MSASLDTVHDPNGHVLSPLVDGNSVISGGSHSSLPSMARRGTVCGECESDADKEVPL